MSQMDGANISSPDTRVGSQPETSSYNKFC